MDTPFLKECTRCSISVFMDPLQEALDLFDRGEIEAALASARGAAGAPGSMAERDVELDLRGLTVDCLIEIGDLAAAEAEVRVMRTLAPADETARLQHGIIRYYLWDLKGAEAIWDGLKLWGDSRAELLAFRARLCELRGELDQADRLYDQAFALAPSRHPQPPRVPARAIRKTVEEVLEGLPAPVRDALGEVTVEVRPMPDPALHAGADTDPDLLGLYTGTNLMERDAMGGGGPALDRIFLFQRNLERMCQTEEEVLEQVRITLLHEIGHHVGWDEDEVEERGLG
jgi:predicted Zn-dependent protease with MMP-like domain